MNRENFLKTFFNLYSASFTNTNTAEWLEAYKSVLSIDVDFDELYSTLMNEWDKKTAPPPCWLKAKKKFKEGREPEKELSIANIWGTAPNGFDYCFGYNTEESNYGLEAEKLLKMGFRNIRKEEQCNKVLT